jgi:four helix bundle protein
VALSPYSSVDGTRYKELVVYRQAVALADDLRQATLGWNSFDAWSLGIQLVRASDSIGANIAEAYGRRGDPDQRRLLYVARGSAYEAEHWIDRAHARSLLSAGFEPRITEVIRLMNGLIRSHLQGL